MNPLVLFILTLGVALGYGFARIQLRGRFELAAEAIGDAERGYALPPPAPPMPIRPHAMPAEPRNLLLQYGDLTPIRCKCGRRVEHFSAKQVLSTHQDEYGFPRTPQYPNGLEGWYRNHGFPTRTPE